MAIFSKSWQDPEELEEDPVDPDGEDDEEDEDAPKGGKANPLKRWASSKVLGALKKS